LPVLDERPSWDWQVGSPCSPHRTGRQHGCHGFRLPSCTLANRRRGARCGTGSEPSLVLESDQTALIQQRFADLGLKLTDGAHVDEIDEIDDVTSSPIASRVTDLHDVFADLTVRGS
jgi:hypothetical protein